MQHSIGFHIVEQNPKTFIATPDSFSITMYIACPGRIVIKRQIYLRKAPSLYICTCPHSI